MKNKNTGIPPFPFDFCVQQFPFIAEDFDALTTYELISKIVCYLNDLRDEIVNINSEIDEMKTELENTNSEIERIKEFIHMDDNEGE